MLGYGLRLGLVSVSVVRWGAPRRYLVSCACCRPTIMFIVSANLTIIFEHGEDGFWIATIPEIPGAFSQGLTQEEARENVLEAATELMEARRDLALQEKGVDALVETVSLAQSA